MGSCHGSLSVTIATAAKDDTIKWYLDTNAGITVGVPISPPLSTDSSILIRLLLLLPQMAASLQAGSRGNFIPLPMQKYITIELDYPLLEYDDAIQRFKLPSVERGGGIGTPTVSSALELGYHLTVSSLAAAAVALGDP
ncbi:hypothetical protein Tco_0671637 [Tanacetum coccineum]